jgi:hypothetical protein
MSGEQIETIQEYRDLRKCSESENYSEAIDRHEAAYPARWPIEFREFRGLNEDDQREFWAHLGAKAPLWRFSECLGWVESHERTYPMVLAMAAAHRMAARRLCIFLDTWSMCDDTRPHWSWLAEMPRSTRTQVDITEFLEPEARDWFNAAPAEITVYRGCEAGQERGLSWTFDQLIATGFAHGKRYFSKNPTLVHAVIPKRHVFAVILDRSEKEIVLDPRRLCRVRKAAIEQSSMWGAL